MIIVNLEKARILAHDWRRKYREDEFAPYDAIIAKQIPGQVQAAEQARVRIRERYALVQELIDEADSIDAIQAALS